jgi:thiamine pyrophosphate-dependent acetolactate synthase large subunit-like protein
VITGGEAVVRGLERHGVELVFGIPGTHTLPIYRHLAGSSIRHVTPRHEQGAGFAADGYARSAGRAGVCLLTTGPGVTNAATAAATAYADAVPLLIVSSAVPRPVEGTGSGYLHESKDQRGAIASLVGESHYPCSVAEIDAAIDRAFSFFDEGRPSPVHIGIPIDVLDRTGPALTSVEPPASRDRHPDPASIAAAATVLRGARTVGMILGGGARGAQRAATAVAERLEAGVVTSVNGKGVLAEGHRLSLGASLRLGTAQRWLAAQDCVVAVGTELGQSDLWADALEFGGELIRVDAAEAQLGKNAAPRVAIRGDAGIALEALLETLAGDPPRDPRDLTDVRAAVDEEASSDGAPWRALCGALAAAMGEDAVLCADTTMGSYFGAVHFLPLSSPSRFHYPTGYATLGYAVPAAIGAKLARPDAPVIALTGDGGLMFTVGELAWAAELALSLPIVVVNNGGYGVIKREMVEAGIEPVGVDLRPPDLPALAEAMGCRGVRVEHAGRLEQAISAALTRPQPTLIECQEET